MFNSAARAQRRLQNVVIDMKMAQKSLLREAKKMAASSEASKRKIKKAMEKGDMELAKIHAESSIRQKNTARNFERLATRVEAVYQRVQQAMAANQLNQNMTKVTQGLAKVLATMQPEQIAAKLDEFEQQNETLDVRVDFMDGAISNTVAGATPEGEVNTLMKEMADVVGLDISKALEDDLPLPRPVKTEEEGEKEDVRNKV